MIKITIPNKEVAILYSANGGVKYDFADGGDQATMGGDYIEVGKQRIEFEWACRVSRSRRDAKTDVIVISQ